MILGRKRHARIVVAVERADALTLDIVQCVYDESFRQLHCLFIENTRLLEHASSSLAREVMTTGVERRLDANALSTQWKAQAAQVRRAVETTAAKLGVPLVFQVTRGEAVPELKLVPPDTGLLVIGVADPAAASVARLRTAIDQLEQGPFRALLIARPGWGSSHNILTVATGSPDAVAIAQLGSRLAQRSASTLSLIVPAASESPELDEIDGTIERVDELDVDTVVAAAQRGRARLIVMPWKSRNNEAALLTNLLQRTDSALLLVK